METASDILSDEAWVSRLGGRILIHFGLHLRNDLDRTLVNRLLRRRDAIAAFWSYNWDCGREGPWYAFICDTPGYTLDRIRSANARYKIRRSLRTCRIGRIEPEWLAENGYRTYLQATSRYQNHVVETEASYRRELLGLVGRPDVRIHGVFADEQLIAYGLSFVRGRGVRLGASPFDPAFSAARPMYGLYYTIAREYLAEGEFDFVDNGTRPLLHSTNMEDFLAHLGWRRAYCSLGMQLRPVARAGFAVARLLRRPAHWLLPRHYSALIEAALAAQDLARASTNDRLARAPGPSAVPNALDDPVRGKL